METVQFSFPAPQGSGNNLGLTKLEYFTAIAMGALIESGLLDCRLIGQTSVKVAIATLEAIQGLKTPPSGAV